MSEAPKRRWFQFAVAAVAACVCIAFAATNLYFALYGAMCFAGVTVIVGMLVAGDWLVRKCCRKKNAPKTDTSPTTHC